MKTGANGLATSAIEVHGAVKRYGAIEAVNGVDLVIETELKAHDIVPLIPIVRGAGGIVRWIVSIMSAIDLSFHRSKKEFPTSGGA